MGRMRCENCKAMLYYGSGKPPGRCPSCKKSPIAKAGKGEINPITKIVKGDDKHFKDGEMEVKKTVTKEDYKSFKK